MKQRYVFNCFIVCAEVMARDARDKARRQLSALAGGTVSWVEARRLEQDAELLGRWLAAAASHQQSGGRAADVTSG
jgi:hypothetical protein